MAKDKSFIVKVEEKILIFTKPDYMGSQEKVKELLSQEQSEDKPVKSIFKSRDFNGLQVFEFGDKSAKNLIVYVHGGAFIGEINWQHYLFCLLLSRKLDAYVLAPVYPLAPAHSAMETFDLIRGFYESLIQEHDNISLMGDSAGGGFVLSFCQYLNEINLPQPDNIITYSPWVDISLSNTPYDNDSDPILGEVGLREIGKVWAGELETKDYKVSPLFGDNSNLPKTLIFVGDNEIFYKDILKYYENLKRDNVDARLVVGSGMFHIYPLFPIPEARDTFKELKKEFE